MSNIRNLHHRRSIRLKGYDYSQEGLYFVTFCVQDRVCLFGSMVDGKMILNEFGKIAEQELLKTNEIRQNVEIDSFVVMPNHVHFIAHISRDNARRGELHSPNLEKEMGEFNSPRPRGPSQTVGAIVRGYKSAVTKQLYALGFVGKLWQRNYYEHIIRTPESYERIVNYIENNPVKWVDDKFHC